MSTFRSTRSTLKNDLVSHLYQLLFQECRIVLLTCFAERVSTRKHIDYKLVYQQFHHICHAIRIVSHTNTFDDSHFDHEGIAQVTITKTPLLIQSSTGGKINWNSKVLATLLPALVFPEHYVPTSNTPTLSPLSTTVVSAVLGATSGVLQFHPYLGIALQIALAAPEVASVATNVMDITGLFSDNNAYQMGVLKGTIKPLFDRLFEIPSNVATWCCNFVSYDNIVDEIPVRISQQPDRFLFDQILAYHSPMYKEFSDQHLAWMRSDTTLFQSLNPWGSKAGTVHYYPGLDDTASEEEIKHYMYIEGTLIEWTVLFWMLEMSLALFVLGLSECYTTDEDVADVVVVYSNTNEDKKERRLRRFLRFIMKNLRRQIHKHMWKFTMMAGTITYGFVCIHSLAQQETLRPDATITYDYAEAYWALRVCASIVRNFFTQTVGNLAVTERKESSEYRAQLAAETRKLRPNSQLMIQDRDISILLRHVANEGQEEEKKMGDVQTPDLPRMLQTIISLNSALNQRVSKETSSFIGLLHSNSNEHRSDTSSSIIDALTTQVDNLAIDDDDDDDDDLLLTVGALTLVDDNSILALFTMLLTSMLPNVKDAIL